MRRVGDRRSNLRLEVVGSLWGTLETPKRAQVLNASDSGALLLSPVSLPVNTVHHVQLTSRGVDRSAQVRVCHVRPAGDAAFYLGVEVIAPGATAPESSLPAH
jgi:hypothetical protein